jgi:N-acetylglucosamine malate deacetylase 1
MSTTPYGIDVLAFGPHPDDVEIFCGGIVITLAGLGHRVGIVDLTRGELGSQGTVDERKAEAAAAARVMGTAFRENLGLPDGLLDASPDSPHLPVAVETIRRHRPELMLLPWKEERHPDHVAASALLTRAAFMAGLRKFDLKGAAPFAPRQILYYEMRHRMPASFIVDTSKAWETKARAIACHPSQITRRDAEAATLISSPMAIEAIEARDRYRGAQIGVTHGEALCAASALGLSDPVAHFRANPFPHAHAFEAQR